ncbi:DrmB family protein [Bradyrhizobium sp. HKCCYLR20261]|uniref:DrmB family protein n=1 Tax=Bradyrhizobium sp. HKCCYLR20261 TaxID=3420760 RepID=UPI003EBEDBD0
MADITQNFSQLLLTYGPGAMMDLPDNAVVVSGLQDWDYKGSSWKPVEEERLVALLKQQLGTKLSATFNGLRHPPMFDEDRRDGNAPGVAVRLFPCWFLVNETQSKDAGAAPDGAAAGNEKRRRMVEFSELDVTAGGRLSYTGGGGKAGVNPIRFVGACTKGHLQDISWRYLTHRGRDQSCRKPLFWVERGVSSDPSDISVQCTCGASISMADLYKPKFLGTCDCHSPWLTPRRDASETCTEDLRLLPRSATNTYFPQTVTVISLTKSNDALRQAIAQNKTAIDSIRSLPNFLEFLRAFPQLKDAFKEFSDDQILQALNSDDGSGANPSENPRIPEFDMMASGAPVIGSDSAGSFFYAETLPKDALGLQAPWDAFLHNVVRVHRLREVTCLYGFTRLEPPPTPAESELDEIQLAVGGADLARSVEWLPAIEQFGEGIFLHVAPEFLQRWLDADQTVAKARNLRERENRDAARFNREPTHRGIAYWALHSLSHAFMAELALDCGYPLSSLKERIYSSGPAQAQRFGILIYTSTAGGQGTLGGLSHMAERAGDLLTRATRRLALCSNDPICAEHSDASEEYPLQGAACHACLLVPETSCEARNTRLDRGLLTRTVLGGGLPLLD